MSKPFMSKPSILVIIPTYNHLDYAVKCLISLAANKPKDTNCSVIVVDDNSEEWHDFKFPMLKQLDNMFFTSFDTHEGLTRSWNFGLRTAKDLSFDYSICTNSDVLFTPDWFEPLHLALSNGFNLVGPVTNAPGHRRTQDVRRYIVKHDINDSIEDRLAVVDELQATWKQTFCRHGPINGFFMMARTSEWWKNAYDDGRVFNQYYPLTGNEDELQHRWRGKISVICTSYIFHYRSISRPEALNSSESEGAFRSPA